MTTLAKSGKDLRAAVESDPGAGNDTGAGALLGPAAGAGCGAVVMVLTLGTFSALNGVSVDVAALGGWAVADVVANLAMLFCARALAARAHDAVGAEGASNRAKVASA